MAKPINGGFDRPHVEQWTLALQRHYLKLERIGDAELLATLEGWLRESVPGACTFNRFAIGASHNHDFEILGAACCSPDRDLAAQAREGFILGLRCMLGEKEPDDVGLPEALRFWGGSEQLSSDYEPMRLRAVCGLRLGWPKHEEAQRVSGLYFATDAALWALAAAPGPDRVAHRAGHGGLFYGGPALPPVGGRSNHHGQVENEPAFCLLAGIRADWAENRYGDALPFLRLLDGDFGPGCARLALLINEGHDNFDMMGENLGEFLALLASVRFQERQHFVRWADGSVACWVDRQPSHLSPSYVAWVYRAGAETAAVGFPFRENAKNRGKGNDYPLATAAETDGHLVIQGGNAESSPIELPQGQRLYHVIVSAHASLAMASQEAINGPISQPATDPGSEGERQQGGNAAQPPTAKKENLWTGWI